MKTPRDIIDAAERRAKANTPWHTAPRTVGEFFQRVFEQTAAGKDTRAEVITRALCGD